MKIIALITAAYLPGTYVAVFQRIEREARSMLTCVDSIQHGNVQFTVIWRRRFKQSSLARSLDLLGGHCSADDYHYSWLGDMVEIRDVSFRQGRANRVPWISEKKV